MKTTEFEEFAKTYKKKDKKEFEYLTELISNLDDFNELDKLADKYNNEDLTESLTALDGISLLLLSKKINISAKARQEMSVFARKFKGETKEEIDKCVSLLMQDGNENYKRNLDILSSFSVRYNNINLGIILEQIETGRHEILDRCNELKNSIENNNLNEYLENYVADNSMKDINEKIFDFEEELIEFENHIFGLTLYYDTMPSIYRFMNKKSINNILSRSNRNLNNAKNILDKVKKDNEYISELEEFSWIPRPKLMDDKIKVILSTYNLIFGNRPKKRLSKDEAKILREKLVCFL